ncbi:MAG: hypothetical protein KDC23_05445 [Actinobacteria bacterium]|nr:hypothetical protein [Actinomycetota bacterium]
MIYSRRGTRMMVESTLFGTLIGVLVVLPWAAGGYLLLLDWVSGPNQSLTPGVYGLSGSAVDAMPFRIATQGLRWLVGPAATSWVVIGLFFPLAAGGIAAATRGTRWRVYPAVLLFVCNPFVVDRIRAGHVAMLLCLALLPWIFTASVHARKQNKLFAVRPALWLALAMAISPHAAWLGGTIVLMVWLLPRPTARGAVRALGTVVAAGAVYTYAAVVWLTGARTLNVTQADLAAYATWEGPGGLAVTVLSLRGYWRTGAPGWDVWSGVWFALPLLLVVLVLVCVGLALRVFDDPLRGAPLAALTAVGLLLGAGINGPLGTFYGWAFDTLPLFEAMREQQKWVALAVMGYAVGLGAAVEAIARRGRPADSEELPATTGASRLARPLALVAAGLPLLIAPTLLWGLGNSVRTSDYPESWYRAEEVMGPGQGGVLFLPWHAYQPFDFTDERTVATPGTAFFSRPVLASDAVQLPNLLTDSTSRRTDYLNRLVAIGGGGSGFPRLLAPLGIEYVVLADNISTPEYSWLRESAQLQRIDVGPGLELYRVIPQGTGRVVDATTMTFDEAVAAASADDLGSEAVLDPADGAVTQSAPAEPESTADRDAAGGLVQSSPTTWRLDPGPAGWVVVPEEWSANWRLDGVTGRPTLAGTVAIPAGAEAGTVEFVTWRWLRPALAASILALLALGAAGVIEHRRDTEVLLPSWGPMHFGSR